jgi:PleD family two-component response regulator
MDLIARSDSGRFSLLLPRTTLQEWLIVAERVQQTIDLNDPPFDCNPVRFALRVGVAEVAEGDDPVRLLQRAEAAILPQHVHAMQ